MQDGNVIIALIVTAFLIFLNGRLASAEIAMMSLSEARLHDMAQDGNKRATLLLHMKQHPTSFLSTVQVGITLAGLLSGAFAADTLAQPLVAWAIDRGLSGVALGTVTAVFTFLITLLMTFFMLVFGELVPKRLAMARPEQTALRIAKSIHILSRATKPLVALLTATTNGVLRLLGVDPGAEEQVTEDDVLVMMRAGQRQGQIAPVEVEVVKNLFAFTDLKVETVMTHRTALETLPADGNLSDILSSIAKTGYNKFPVVDGSVDRIVGVLYTKDIAVYLPSFADSSAPKISDLMRSPLFVSEDKMLADLFADMKRSRDRVAVVVDDYGGTAGIITFTDIIEEILGDFDTQAPAFSEVEPGIYRVDGLADMGRVAPLLGLGDGFYGTFSGFLIDLLGYVPQQSETPKVRHGAHLFQVESMAGGLIRSALVLPTAADSASPHE